MIIQGVVETALYVEDLPRALAFYQKLFELPVLFSDDRGAALNVDDRQVLLLFRRGGSLQKVAMQGGTIPEHDGQGPVHVGFAIRKEDLADWEAKLIELGVPIESRITWPRGGISLYFRDPDRHLLELLTPGVWEIY